MTFVIGCDPGPLQSAVVLYDAEANTVLHSTTGANESLLLALQGHGGAESLFGWVRGLVVDGHIDDVTLVIEKIEAMGMAVGASTFETVFWTGRLFQAWPHKADRVTRRQVKLHLCGNMRAKDPNIRQVLIDKVGPQGTKKAPGPTYQVHGHEFSALAVAVTWAELSVTRPVMSEF